MRKFGQIHWHVVQEPRATLQGAATWWIQCLDHRATCHIAQCCHLANSMYVISEPCVTLQGAAAWWIRRHDPRATCHTAGWKNFICRIENRFLPYFILFSINAVWALASGGFRIVFDTVVGLVRLLSVISTYSHRLQGVDCMSSNIYYYYTNREWSDTDESTCRRPTTKVSLFDVCTLNCLHHSFS